jgi:AraC family transcriptional regulator of adaptative response/methylated-DNA-[protein]-cysteine methyltransferase
MKITDSIQCDIWYQALLERAVEFTGVFFVGVKTTGVFCISVCRARKPRRENVEFYNDFKSALDAGFRPCKVCRPTENARTAPAFVEQALRLLREDPKVRLSDSELRQHDISPNAFAAGSCKTTGSPFRLFNGCSV